jgi:hypothetical protein
MTLEDLKANEVPEDDQQHKEFASKYSEDRNDHVASSESIIPTAETNYWTPEDCDDLFSIIRSIQARRWYFR